jgi:rubredoxin---NAD+ reductase
MFGREEPIEDHPGAPGERRWICRICGWILDERAGDPGSGVPAGTALDEIPGAWRCPRCRAGRGDFAPFLEDLT